MKFYFPTNCFQNFVGQSVEPDELKTLEFLQYLNLFASYTQKMNFYFLQCFNSARAFSTFLYLKICQNLLIKIKQFYFFPLKAETQGFL